MGIPKLPRNDLTGPRAEQLYNKKLIDDFESIPSMAFASILKLYRLVLWPLSDFTPNPTW